MQTSDKSPGQTRGFFKFARNLVLQLKSALSCGFKLTGSGDKKRTLSRNEPTFHDLHACGLLRVQPCVFSQKVDASSNYKRIVLLLPRIHRCKGGEGLDHSGTTVECGWPYRAFSSLASPLAAFTVFVHLMGMHRPAARNVFSGRPRWPRSAASHARAK